MSEQHYITHDDVREWLRYHDLDPAEVLSISITATEAAAGVMEVRSLSRDANGAVIYDQLSNDFAVDVNRVRLRALPGQVTMGV